MSAFTKRRADRAGFLLIELLAASLILSTALVVLSRSFSNSAALLQHASYLLRAETLLEEKLGALEQDSSLQTGSEEGAFPGFSSFHWSSEIQQEASSSLYQVTLTVSWKEGRRPHLLTVATLFEKLSETPP